MQTIMPASPPAKKSAAAAEPTDNITEYTVSELSFSLKRSVEEQFGHVRVRGELGRVSRPASGHVYLDLKDDKAVLAGVLWRSTASRLSVQPEEGMDVVCTGKLTTYPGQSKYQIVIDSITPAGVGALMALLEKRRKALEAEGLFSPDRKKPLPVLPEVIGVVTSPTGAVIRDILHRLQERFPRHVIVWPVRVQGDSAAGEIAAAIKGFNNLPEKSAIPRPDLIIVARGGGSIEDLWAFNEEAVVRAAAESVIPLVSAIGHETDTTLIDHAADKRAPTPTAAAEMAVPVRADLLEHIASLALRQSRAGNRLLSLQQQRLAGLARGIPRLADIMALPRQRLDVATLSLHRALRRHGDVKNAQLAAVAARLSPAAMTVRMTHTAAQLHALGGRMRQAVRTLTRTAAHALESNAKLLAALSYESVLERGFALVRDSDSRPVRRAAQTSPGMALSIEFAQRQRVSATVTGPARPQKTAEKSAGKILPKKKKKQESLF